MHKGTPEPEDRTDEQKGPKKDLKNGGKRAHSVGGITTQTQAS